MSSIPLHHFDQQYDFQDEYALQGPEIGGVLELLSEEDGDVVDKAEFRNLDDRINTLKDWLAKQV